MAEVFTGNSFTHDPRSQDVRRVVDVIENISTVLFEVAVTSSTLPGSLKDPLTLTDRQTHLCCDLPIGTPVDAKTNDITITRLPVNLVLS